MAAPGRSSGSAPKEQGLSVLDSFSLTGKTAVVTGATRGLGRAFAHALAEAGAKGASSFMTGSVLTIDGGYSVF